MGVGDGRAVVAAVYASIVVSVLAGVTGAGAIGEVAVVIRLGRVRCMRAVVADVINHVAVRVIAGIAGAARSDGVGLIGVSDEGAVVAVIADAVAVGVGNAPRARGFRCRTGRMIPECR